MKYCAKCILPENYPGISFDANGVCNYCATYEIKNAKGKKELDNLLSSIHRVKSDYDCLVGISGGRDSAYTLYYLVKKYDLKVLAYSADNGFVPELAKINMKTMTKILGVDFVLEKHDLVTKCIKPNIAAWLKWPSPAMIPMMCCGCRLGMFRGLLRQAKRNNIQLIALGSGNTVEISHFKRAYFRINPFGKIVKSSDRISILFGLLYEVFKNPRYLFSLRAGYVYVLEYFYFFLFETIQKMFYPTQKTLFLYDYVEWNENEIMNTMEQVLNWKMYSSGTSAWRSDCAISFLKNYLLREMVGFNEKTELLCNMIREGMISKEEAERRLGSANVMPVDIIRRTLKRIGLETSRIENVLGSKGTILHEYSHKT
jgi:hypothetical protein